MQTAAPASFVWAWVLVATMTALLLGMVTAAIEEIQTQILTIETRTDAERYYKSEALKLSPSISPRSSTRSTRVTS